MKKLFLILSALISIILCSLLFAGNKMIVPEQKVYLERLYATSTDLDSHKYGVENLFDRKDTVWKSMPGTGPNEGILIVFEKPTYVDHLSIKQSANKDCDLIKSVQVVADGVDNKEWRPRRINIFHPVKTIFIKPSSKGILSRKSDVKKESGEQRVLESTIDISKKAISIEEILIFDKNNRRLDIVSSKMVNGNVKASSTLKPIEAYNTDFLFDSRIDFGWSEGKKGSGINESISFMFDKDVTITKLKIWNGYQRSEKHFKANGRIEKFSFGDDKKTYEFKLKDLQGYQIIDFKKPIKGRNFTLKIKSIYKGAKYKDLVISELRFSDDQKWFYPYSNRPNKRKAALLKRVKGSLLEKIVDHNIKNTEYNGFEGLEDESEKEVLIRSNNSFVIWVYETSTSTGGSSDRNDKITVYDGNWIIESIKKNKVVIKIFGKKLRVSDNYDYYGGIDSKQETTAIFQDYLTITPGKIMGKKVFEKIKF